MPIIPHSIASHEYATYGEKKLHEIFSKMYSESEEEFVWYEPPALDVKGERDSTQKRHTDFIIFSQHFGIINLEVKDWRPETVTKVDAKTWQIRKSDGSEEAKESPFEQSRRCSYGIKERLQKHNALVRQEGKHRGKLKFPFTHGVVLSHFERSSLFASSLHNGIESEDQIFYKEDLQFDPTDREARLAFEGKLRRMFTSAKFAFEPLTYREVQVLRKAIWPELEVTPLRTVAPVESSEEQDPKLLDLKQEDFAKSLGDGHYVLRGVAGSGKTLVLAYRARYLARLRADWNILFVCFNKSLKNYVRRMLDNITNGTGREKRIVVTHFHGLVRSKTGESVEMLDGESHDDWDVRIGLMLRTAAMSGKLIGGKYDAIMIDEAQDFSTEWLTGVRLLLNKSDSLTIALDPAQDIYGRKRVWKQSGIEVVGGGRSKKLKQSYRNTNEILQLAIGFQNRGDFLEDESDPEGLLKPDAVARHGQRAIIQKIAPSTSLALTVGNQIHQFQKQGFALKEIGVILCDAKALKAEELLTQGIPTLDLVPTQNRDRFDIDDDNVKVITVESSKGLEWRAVLLVGVDSMPRQGRQEALERKRLYIGITRAQEQLVVYYREHTKLIDELIAVNERLS